MAIGRALAARPAIIMTDEPTGNLDSKNSQEVFTLLKSMSAKYRQTILMISHNENHADMAMRSQKNYFIKTNGECHAALHDVEAETAELISARVDVALSGWVCQGSTEMLSGKAVSFVGADGATYRIRFKDGAHIRESIKEIREQLRLSGGQISENTALLGLMGQSESNIMQALYLIATILVFLVLIAGTVTLHTPLGEKKVRIAGILSSTNASGKAGSFGYIVCSERLFVESIGAAGYTVVDIQLTGSGSDKAVSAIRRLLPTDCFLSDKRLSNSESQSSYDTGGLLKKSGNCPLWIP